MWCLCKALACSTISIRQNKTNTLIRKTSRRILERLWARSNMTAGLTMRSEEYQEKRKKKKKKRRDMILIEDMLHNCQLTFYKN